MKGSKSNVMLDNFKSDLQFKIEPPMEEQVQANTVSLEAAETIQDMIIGTVAKQMWEKEVTVKYKLPFAAKWSA